VGTIIRSTCNICGHETDHDVLHQENTSVEDPSGGWLVTRQYALSCRGCHDRHLRAEERYFHVPTELDDDEVTPTVTFQPPRLWRRAPDWIDQLDEVDADLGDLLKEIYSATNDGQTKLLYMGIRTALDHLMSRMLGGDIGGFEQKLSAMVTQGHLTATQKQNLEIVIDAGSASSHRGYRPPRELIKSMLVTMEGLIQNYYITGPMLQTARAQIPPRPPRHRPGPTASGGTGSQSP